MKVLITCDTFPPDFLGGGYETLLELSTRLVNHGFQVEVLTAGNPKIKNFEGIITHKFPLHRYFLNFAFHWIYKHAKNFDLIQTNTFNTCMPSYFVGKFLKKPVVCYVHGIYGEDWKSIKGPIIGSFYKFIEKIQLNHKFDKIVFPAEFSRDVGLKMGIPKKITEIINPGFQRNKIKVKEKKNFVLYIGRLVKQKGLEYLIEAARSLPDVKLVIAGKGDEENNLKKMATKNVSFLGYVSDEKKFDLLAEASIFCMPSIKEGFGIALAEAMASGCAIVSTVPLDFKGFLIPPKSSLAIKNAIEKLIKNPKLCENFGRENIQKSKQYDWEKFTKGFIKIYKELS
jgi:glycosyltransferase involved in cell wall biosynthesis